MFFNRLLFTIEVDYLNGHIKKKYPPMEDIDNANPHHSLKTSFSKGDMSPLERKAVEAEALATII
ncbi:MAG: hypothetical protein ACI906_005013, partial [Candidatus Latescibacterota bacterium]